MDLNMGLSFYNIFEDSENKINISRISKLVQGVAFYLFIYFITMIFKIIIKKQILRMILKNIYQLYLKTKLQ